MHRRPGAGIGGLKRQEATTQAYKPLSSVISNAQIDALQSNMSTFRTRLTHFARTHRDRIKNDANFRQSFQRMCAAIGVDPLAGPRQGGWWAELMGFGDFTYELAIQVVEVCVNTREMNGGLIELKEVLRIVKRLRAIGGADEADGALDEEDLVRSIKTLEVLGAGYQVVQVGNRRMVRSVMKELDADQSIVLAVAQASGGVVDEKSLLESKGWTSDRARTALENMLMRDGLCWIDEQGDGGVTYWVPSAMIWEE